VIRPVCLLRLAVALGRFMDRNPGAMDGIACFAWAIRPPEHGGKTLGRSISKHFQHSGARFRPSSRPRSAARNPVLMLFRGFSRWIGAENASKTRLLRQLSRSSLFKEPKRDDRRQSVSSAARYPFRRGIGPPLRCPPSRFPFWEQARFSGAGMRLSRRSCRSKAHPFPGGLNTRLSRVFRVVLAASGDAFWKPKRQRADLGRMARKSQAIGCRLVWGIAEAGRPPCRKHGPARGTFVPTTFSAFRKMQRLPRRSG
jgi:hypothetical protein